MIFSIQINFVQIGGSLGMTMDVPWPDVYKAWMVQLDFANFDILSMLGVTCLPGMSYELKFMSSTLMPLGLVFLVALIYFCKKSSLKSKMKEISEEEAIDGANHLFNTVDVDESEEIDMEEFGLCLSQIAGKKIRKTGKELRELMLSLGAKVPEGEHEYEPVLNRQQFVKAVLNNKVGGKGHTGWIRFMASDRLRSTYVAIAVQVLLLCHAPTSKRVLYFCKFFFLLLLGAVSMMALMALIFDDFIHIYFY
jgi:Ca2+/Na+ antiporter